MEIKLVRDKINIAGNTFIFDRVNNLDELIEQVSDDEFNKDERLPYWAELWPSALALSEYILLNQTLFKDKNIIELGCGIGLTTMALSKTKPAQLIATDYEEPALENTRNNFKLNKIQTIPQLQLLDWREPDIDQKFDVIVASDVAYEERFFQPLINIFHKLLKEDGIIILAEPNRSIARSFFGKIVLAGFKYFKEDKLVQQEKKDITISIYKIHY